MTRTKNLGDNNLDKFDEVSMFANMETEAQSGFLSDEEMWEIDQRAVLKYAHKKRICRRLCSRSSGKPS